MTVGMTFGFAQYEKASTLGRNDKPFMQKDGTPLILRKVGLVIGFNEAAKAESNAGKNWVVKSDHTQLIFAAGDGGYHDTVYVPYSLEEVALLLEDGRKKECIVNFCRDGHARLHEILEHNMPK